MDDKSTDYESRQKRLRGYDDYRLQRKLTAVTQLFGTINYGMAWFIVGWHALALVGVAVLIVWDRLTRPPNPTRAEIEAEADAYETRHGEEAFRQIGTDMHEERCARGINRRYRFLREVSGALVQRIIDGSATPDRAYQNYLPRECGATSVRQRGPRK